MINGEGLINENLVDYVLRKVGMNDVLYQQLEQLLKNGRKLSTPENDNYTNS
tara:strand:- start:500 stop:655 length:156 start_codon:yes stop_codon:yes gene_type:complete